MRSKRIADQLEWVSTTPHWLRPIKDASPTLNGYAPRWPTPSRHHDKPTLSGYQREGRKAENLVEAASATTQSAARSGAPMPDDTPSGAPARMDGGRDGSGRGVRVGAGGWQGEGVRALVQTGRRGDRMVFLVGFLLLSFIFCFCFLFFSYWWLGSPSLTS